MEDSTLEQLVVRCSVVEDGTKHVVKLIRRQVELGVAEEVQEGFPTLGCLSKRDWGRDGASYGDYSLD